MAVTRLSDVIVPDVFLPYMLKETQEKSAVFQSGILRNDPNLANFLRGGGQLINVPFWNDLGTPEPNTSSDDPGSSATPQKISADKDVAVRINRNQGWSDADLAAELAGDDPMKRIGERVSSYWSRAYQKHLISVLKGVFADNAANNSGDMRVEIGTDAVGTATAAELVSAEAILDTKQTMGDAADALDTLVMHSVVFTRLQKLNLIDFIPDSRGEVRFPTYLGYNVVVDDGVPAIAGSNRIKYSTYLVGKGAFGFAEVPPAVPVEVEREAAQGDGAGVEEIWTRRQYIMHPYGIKWTSSSMAGQSPTNTEAEAAANWSRVYPERKQVPLAELVTNG